MSTTTPLRIELSAIDGIISSLRQQHYTVVGPTVRGASIVLDEISSTSDLPVGWMCEQAPARYRLIKLPVDSLFAHTVGPHSWKQYLFPPILRLFSANRNDGEIRIGDGLPGSDVPGAGDAVRPYAFLGVRSCDLHAILIQDKIFGGGPYQDAYYRRVREQTWIIAVNCTLASATCFCASTKTGPKASSGYDLALTEVITEQDHYFIVEVGTERGLKLLEGLNHRPANESETARAAELVEGTASQMARSLETENIREVLYQSADHTRWEAVAKRCLTCANCTMVCPTCFCATVEDTVDLTGMRAERLRKWDSCFNMDFSYIHGGSVRSSVKARYRHWLTHKLASWIDQFGTLGCVGCGRCITWCPVGIDITEEYRAIRDTTLTNLVPSSTEEVENGNA
ncbi:MAG: sulfite reductase subunit A [Ignavibacteria bacterium]|nr:sulfite reductase subunit A [Ignavibacteria bacterium]